MLILSKSKLLNTPNIFKAIVSKYYDLKVGKGDEVVKESRVAVSGLFFIFVMFHFS